MRFFKKKMPDDDLQKLADRNQWAKDISGIEDDLTLDALKFIFEQAKEYLDETLTESNTILTRSTTLLGVQSGLIIFMGGYIFSKANFLFKVTGNNIIFHLRDNILFFPVIICLGYIVAVMMLGSVNLVGTKFYGKGSKPINWISNKDSDKNPSKQKILTQLYLSQIVIYQENIDYNERQNQRRAKRFYRAFLRTLFTPLLFLLLMLALLCYLF